MTHKHILLHVWNQFKSNVNQCSMGGISIVLLPLGGENTNEKKTKSIWENEAFLNTYRINAIGEISPTKRKYTQHTYYKLNWWMGKEGGAKINWIDLVWGLLNLFTFLQIHGMNRVIDLNEILIVAVVDRTSIAVRILLLWNFSLAITQLI